MVYSRRNTFGPKSSTAPAVLSRLRDDILISSQNPRNIVIYYSPLIKPIISLMPIVLSPSETLSSSISPSHPSLSLSLPSLSPPLFHLLPQLLSLTFFTSLSFSRWQFSHLPLYSLYLYFFFLHFLFARVHPFGLINEMLDISADLLSLALGEGLGRC